MVPIQVLFLITCSVMQLTVCAVTYNAAHVVTFKHAERVLQQGLQIHICVCSAERSL